LFGKIKSKHRQNHQIKSNQIKSNQEDPGRPTCRIHFDSLPAPSLFVGRIIYPKNKNVVLQTLSEAGGALAGGPRSQGVEWADTIPMHFSVKSRCCRGTSREHKGMAKRIICSYLLVAGLSARCAAPDGTIPADTSAATVRSLLATLARSPEAKAAYDRIFGPTAAATTGAAVESKALAIAAATVFDPGYVLAVVAEVVAYETGEPRFFPGTTWMLRMKEVLAPAFTEDDSVLLNGLAEIVSLLHLPCPIALGFGPLGTLDAALVRSAVAQITDHGFYVFPRRLAEVDPSQHARFFTFLQFD
jgi:hypothetical protein